MPTPAFDVKNRAASISISDSRKQETDVINHGSASIPDHLGTANQSLQTIEELAAASRARSISKQWVHQTAVRAPDSDHTTIAHVHSLPDTVQNSTAMHSVTSPLEYRQVHVAEAPHSIAKREQM